MDTIDRFSPKAKLYHHRWDYSTAAIDRLLEVTQSSKDTVIADIGAGNGALTRYFVEKVKQVFAIEPNDHMRSIAIDSLQQYPSFVAINGYSDATQLPDRSVDLITVGRALHWFPVESTRSEFLRILKPKGWLAIFKTTNQSQAILEQIRAIQIPQYGWETIEEQFHPKHAPIAAYLEDQEILEFSFASTIQENWSEFLGREESKSRAPSPTHPCYPQFEQEMRNIFDQFARADKIEINVATELFLGQIKSGS